MSSVVGNTAPHFELEGAIEGQIRTFSLVDYDGRWLILFFYPLDFTFVCPTEILAFSDRVDAFRAAGADILGISTDSPYTHLAWLERPREQGGIEGLQYPLLSDHQKTTATAYGVLGDGGVALRGLFLIDPDRIIQHCTVNNLAIGRGVDETLRVLHAAMRVRESGEVCPANWQPGEEAMTPDWTASKQWFAQHANGAPV